MERKVRFTSSNTELTEKPFEIESNQMNFQNLSIEVDVNLTESKPGTSKEIEIDYTNLEFYEITKTSGSGEPVFQTRMLSNEELSKLFPNRKVSYKNSKSNTTLKQEIKNRIFLQELTRIELEDVELEKEIAEARVILERNYPLDSYFLETVVSSTFLLNLSNEEIHNLTNAIDPPEEPLNQEQRELIWVNSVAIENFRNELVRSNNQELIEKYTSNEEFLHEAYVLSGLNYERKSVKFMPTFQGKWFDAFLNKNENREPSLGDFPPEWIELCGKMVNRDLREISEMKKVTLNDLKETIKIHKSLSSYYESLIYFDTLLKEETVRRMVKIEDKETIILGQMSDDVFEEDLSNILRSDELPKPSCHKTEEKNQSSVKMEPKIESKQTSTMTKQIEKIEQSLPTAIEIEIAKLRELPVETVMWLRLNPMLATKAMCHMNPDLKPSLVGSNVIELGWVRNPKNPKILEKPIEDRIVVIDKKPCAVVDINRLFTIELYDPISLETDRVMKCTVHILPARYHTRRFALERIELGLNFLTKYLIKVDLPKRKVILRFDNGATTAVPFDLKKNST
ncbi:hypothetical protein V9T40_000608 [Parthenolecanium corni]|uniref:Uncharacterized protein n=1 Tax=Parthenolecanium corni TaxID=536013 RepID=A0AAN9TBG5_9HEMI